ncbi:hypothetical protein FRX31_015363 [Thalictrum thalictroides]|uniref:Dehydrin n=1 Tax=Thalictrum thalictroides TaxID=46969 RepID=A0A7J6WEK1_THATH|nr:hypothetical protein FRX31_015363 [Thalictrum thalictroides]
MAGIMNKIGDALHIGGNKEEQKHGETHKTEVKHGETAHNPEHKEGFVEKIKDKISGEGGHKTEGGEKKKKKEKKKKEGDHHGHDGSSSSSDSD